MLPSAKRVLPCRTAAVSKNDVKFRPGESTFPPWVVPQGGSWVR